MSSADVHGNFLWHELATTDPGAAGAFYARVLGWKTQAWDKDPSYTVLSTARGPAGGIMKLPAEAQASGAGARWLAYVAVPDVNAAVATAQRLGGRVKKPTSSLPDGATYAVLADPQSGVFGVCAPPSTGPGAVSDEFAWHELATTDHAAAFRFYRELFGWEQLGVHDMGAMGPYLLFGRHGRQLGGIFSRPGASSAQWRLYVRVSSAAKVADAAAAAGGRVVSAPHQVPGGSWVAELTDPQGAAISVNQPAAAAASAATSASAATAATPAAAAAPKPAKPAAPAASPAPVPKPQAPAPKPQVAAPAPARPAPTPQPPARPAAPAAAAHAPVSAQAPRPAAPKATQVPPPRPAPAAASAAGKPATAAPSSAVSAPAPAPAKPQATAPKAGKTAARKAARKAAPRRATAAKKRKKTAARKKSSAKRSATKRRAARGATRRGAAKRGAAGRRKSARRAAPRARKKAGRRSGGRAVRRKSARRRRR